MAIEKQVLAFKRLNLADLCFARAGGLAQHIIETQPDPLEWLYSPMIAGMVVTYMKPFVQADGLGVLPSSFSQFTDLVLGETHKLLAEARHKLYAHQDVMTASSFVTQDGTTPFEMSIRFDGTNRYALSPGAIEIGPASLPDIVRLCAHQQLEIKKAINAAWKALTGGKNYPPGTYRVGVDFP
jgi:hypothetical protein